MSFFPVNRPAQFFPSSRAGCGECHRQEDQAEIRLGDVVVSMIRKSNLRVPAEFSAFVPRAEIRRRFENGQLSEEEITLSGITIVHSPRHRKWTKKETGSPPGPAVPPGRKTSADAVPGSSMSSGRVAAPFLANPGQMCPPRFSSPPVKSWDGRGNWGGVKVAAVERCLPRININGRGKPSGRDATGDGGCAGEGAGK